MLLDILSFQPKLLVTRNTEAGKTWHFRFQVTSSLAHKVIAYNSQEKRVFWLFFYCKEQVEGQQDVFKHSFQ